MAITMLSGCIFPSEDPDQAYEVAGLWQENGTLHYMRFTTDIASEGVYYGREWDEGDDVYESDLVPFGNGWFTYSLDGASMTIINLMDNNGASLPKSYTILSATSINLSFKDNFGKTHNFTKVVEK